MNRKTRILAGAAVTALFSSLANATVVQFQTLGFGTFEVNLYDEGTPATVANFLEYVNAGDYDNAVVHRAVDGFVVQGGGFAYDGTPMLADISSRGSVVNEPVFSNVRATIAMAKLGGDPNSATSQWFINLADNSANLDVQNGGFTVFGEVTGSGMDVLDAIDALPTFDFSGALTSLPLQNYTMQDVADNIEVTDQHLVVVTAIVVLDAAADTAAGLAPIENTLIDAVVNPPPANAGGGGGGGGSTTPAWLFFLSIATLFRFRQRAA